MSLGGSVRFCTIHANIDALPLFSLWKCCASMSFRLLMSVAMLLQCALIVKSTHQQTRGFFFFYLHTERKSSVNGSSCNPSSGNVLCFFFFCCLK